MMDSDKIATPTEQTVAGLKVLTMDVDEAVAELVSLTDIVDP